MFRKVMVFCLVCMLLLTAACGKKNQDGYQVILEGDEPSDATVVQQDEPYPWDNGGKAPEDYTWEEFNALSAGLQIAFQKGIGGEEAFDAWLQRVNPAVQGTSAPEGVVPAEDEKMPWESGGKKPSDYTWKEFDALTGAQQMAFQQSFDSVEAFDAWLQHVNPATPAPVPTPTPTPQPTPEKMELPWENGGKKPSAYTYKEFEALNAAQQIAFQESFGSLAAFDQWLQRVNPVTTPAPETGGDEEVKLPESSTGSKKPSDYTWAEFEAMSAAQQIAFQQSFDSSEDFERWMQRVKPGQSSSAGGDSWSGDGRKPSDYTWEEFEAMSMEDQILFQRSFESFDAFEQWMQRVKPE